MSALACWYVKLEPRSAGVHGTLVALSYPDAWKVSLATYWNTQVVSKPAGTIVACSVAVVGPVPSSDSAVMNGGPGGGGPKMVTVLLPASVTYRLPLPGFFDPPERAAKARPCELVVGAREMLSSWVPVLS